MEGTTYLKYGRLYTPWHISQVSKADKRVVIDFSKPLVNEEYHVNLDHVMNANIRRFQNGTLTFEPILVYGSTPCMVTLSVGLLGWHYEIAEFTPGGGQLEEEVAALAANVNTLSVDVDSLETSLVTLNQRIGTVDANAVKSVNGIEPVNGNVTLPAQGGVSSVNGIQPDQSGNVTIPSDPQVAVNTESISALGTRVDNVNSNVNSLSERVTTIDTEQKAKVATVNGFEPVSGNIDTVYTTSVTIATISWSDISGYPGVFVNVIPPFDTTAIGTAAVVCGPADLFTALQLQNNVVVLNGVTQAASGLTLYFAAKDTPTQPLQFNIMIRR